MSLNQACPAVYNNNFGQGLLTIYFLMHVYCCKKFAVDILPLELSHKNFAIKISPLKINQSNLALKFFGQIQPFGHLLRTALV